MKLCLMWHRGNVMNCPGSGVRCSYDLAACTLRLNQVIWQLTGKRWFEAVARAKPLPAVALSAGTLVTRRPLRKGNSATLQKIGSILKYVPVGSEASRAPWQPVVPLRPPRVPLRSCRKPHSAVCLIQYHYNHSSAYFNI